MKNNIDMEKCRKLYELAEEIVRNAPDESECTDAENEFFAECANIVNCYPDFVADQERRSEMAKRKATIIIPNRLADAINNYLNNEPCCEEECLGEDDTIIFTATFNNKYQMDVKCCGVRYLENETNTAWTEAVLFNEHGVELCSTEPSEEYLGEWNINYGGDEYAVTVSTSEHQL